MAALLRSPTQLASKERLTIRGGRLEDGEFESTGNVCLDEFANAEGEIKIRGSVNTGATPDMSNSAGFV
jgi:hypothetical protein